MCFKKISPEIQGLHLIKWPYRFQMFNDFRDVDSPWILGRIEETSNPQGNSEFSCGVADQRYFHPTED